MIDQIMAVLAEINAPGTPFSAADIAEVSGSEVTLSVGYPVTQVKTDIEKQVTQTLAEAGLNCSVSVEQKIPATIANNEAQAVPGVKNIIAVASGKGGVGKSTTSANIAVALAYEGANVGVLDADIYGPSQSQMFGVADKRPEIQGNTILPLVSHGVQLISMGNLVTEKTPMIWRGPMVTGALKQLLTQTRWNDLDYLIVDMPPGTGDIQLTLSQSVPVSTSVVVTTPQDIALIDAKKGIEMFRQVNIPVAGVVENMSVHVCSNCGHEEAIFGERGGDALAREYQTPILGRLPLKMAIREGVDGGAPSVANDPNLPESLVYREIATGVACDLWIRANKASGPIISMVDD